MMSSGGQQREQHEREISAGRIAGKRDRAEPERDQSAIASLDIVQARGKWILGCEPVIRHEGRSPSARCDVSDEIAIGDGRSPVEPATVEMKDRGALLRVGGQAPPSRYAADGVGAIGHSRGGGDVTHDSIEWRARRDPLQPSLVGLDHRT